MVIAFQARRGKLPSMKRDMDLIRKIMLAVEEHEHGFAPRQIVIEGYTKEQIGYHNYLIINAGLGDGPDLTHLRSESPEHDLRYLTFAGHEFLDAARDDTRWRKA